MTWLLPPLIIWLAGAIVLWRIAIADERRERDAKFGVGRPHLGVWDDLSEVPVSDHLAIAALSLVWPLMFGCIGLLSFLDITAHGVRLLARTIRRT